MIGVVGVSRGRDKFRRADPLLQLELSALQLLPVGFSRILWSVLRTFPWEVGIGLRYPLLKRLAASCGDNVAIFQGAYLLGLHGARFGRNISIHPMCYVDASGGLTIGNDVSIAHGTTIMTTSHTFRGESMMIRDAPGIAKSVRIGNNVWIGAGSRILAGTTLGDRVVIGAGAVVNKDIPSDCLAAGVPARIVEKL